VRRTLDERIDMRRFEYEITRYPSEEFTTLVYSCTGDGSCSLNDVPLDQVEVLKGILNDSGTKGWQLLQLIFAKDGIVAFWKREID
jgi:hypothetical protein